MPETLTDPNIVMGASTEVPVDMSKDMDKVKYGRLVSGEEPTKSENFRIVEQAWGATQARIEGEQRQEFDEKPIEGNKVIPALYQEVVFVRQGYWHERMLVMNAGHMGPHNMKMDIQGNGVKDTSGHQLYVVEMKLPTVKFGGELGYICLQVEVPHTDTSKPLDEFMRTEVPAACARRLRQRDEAIAKLPDKYIRFHEVAGKDGKFQPTNPYLSGFSYQPLKPEQSKEWSGIARPARQLFEAAIDRNEINRQRVLAERETKRAQEDDAREDAKAAKAAILSGAKLSADDL